jgi:hypothetical protein
MHIWSVPLEPDMVHCNNQNEKDAPIKASFSLTSWNVNDIIRPEGYVRSVNLFFEKNEVRCVNLGDLPRLRAPVAQWIERQPPKLKVRVRVPAGAQHTKKGAGL